MDKQNFNISILDATDLTQINVCRLGEMLSQFRATQLHQELANVLLTGMVSQGSRVFAAFNSRNEICGVLTLLLEIKLLSGGCVAGHIEDVVTHPDSQRQGISSALTQYAIQYAQQTRITLADDVTTMRPYKIILDCGDDLSGFYAKQGFTPSGVFMRQYIL